MCENCKDVKTGKILSPKDYLACCKYVKDLVETGGFDFTFSSCYIDSVRDKNGCWADDVITHVIQCIKCGQKFSLSAETYHGSASFEALH